MHTTTVPRYAGIHPFVVLVVDVMVNALPPVLPQLASWRSPGKCFALRLLAQRRRRAHERRIVHLVLLDRSVKQWTQPAGHQIY